MGRIVARLAEPTEVYPNGLVELINRNVSPPTPVALDDVYVRAMYVVSDQVNSFGGRFPVDEHKRLSGLLVDSPVLIGHRKDRLPVARNFHAETVEHDGHHWIKCYFYWLRSAEAASDLRENIDGGIYKECSVAFTFSTPECSVCGRDIRLCEHEPLQTYRIRGVSQRCHFNYRQIERVLETSLVYRGALRDTSLTKELDENRGTLERQNNHHSVNCLVTLRSLDQLDKSGRYLIVPRYEGIPLTATVTEGRLALSYLDGRPFKSEATRQYQPKNIHTTSSIYGHLVGYRGKARCSRQQVEDILAGRATPVSRLVLNIFPSRGVDRIEPADQKSRFDVRTIPYRVTTVSDLPQKAREIMTRLGVEVRPYDQDPVNSGGYYYHPEHAKVTSEREYSLAFDEDAGEGLLHLQDAAGHTFGIAQFDLTRLQQGRRFIATRIEAPVCPRTKTGVKTLDGRLRSITHDGTAFMWEGDGQLAGRFTLRPIKLHGRPMYLFHMVDYRNTNHILTCRSNDNA
jgi:hypothetical protein